MPLIYDDIIVGAGSSGAVLAARLSEDRDRSVLLLEAGPDYPTVEQTPADLLDGRAMSLVDHDWGFTAETGLGRTIAYHRGKVTGGSSAVNATAAPRGMPADYDEWAAWGNEAWSWREVLPYFRKLEDDQDKGGDFHGAGGPLPIRRASTADLSPLQRAFFAACRARGYTEVADLNQPHDGGVGLWPRNQRAGVRISTAIAYLLPARHRLNLTIRPHCLVSRIVFAGNRATGVEVECGGVVQEVYGRRITLSAGAVASPTLLLRSGVGPAADLRALGIEPLADLPGVGANLIDHPTIAVSLLAKPGVEAGAMTGGAFLLWTSAPGSDEPCDLHVIAGTPTEAATEIGMRAMLMRPRSRGRLSLTSADPWAQPRIELNYLAEAEDLRRLTAGLRLALDLARSPEIDQYVERMVAPAAEDMTSESGLEDYVRRNVNTYHHPVGTARMGPEGDAGAVVDQYCRVRGVEGLRVVDASIMPNIVRANTNLTCIMIGERVADWMRAEKPGG